MRIDLPMTPNKWQFASSPGMPPKPNDDGAGWMFAFPSAPSLGDLVTAMRDDIRSASGMTVTYGIEGVGSPPVFVPTPPNTETFVHLLITSQNGSDRWRSGGEDLVVAPTRSVGFTLDPNNWFDPAGNPANSSADSLAAFRALLASPGRVGFTFGVHLSAGGAEFHCLHFAIE